MARTILSQRYSREQAQPGANGEQYNLNFPGMRHQESDNRIGRSNNDVRMGDHDNIVGKMIVDDRLPAIARYGVATAYNHILVPKGRLVSLDPFLSKKDEEDGFYYPVLTLANGGQDTDIDADGVNMKVADADFVLNVSTGRDTNVATRRPANVPLGIMGRMEYTRFDGAFNGMQPAPVLTDKWIHLPLFKSEADARKNAFHAAYNLTESITAQELMNGDKIFKPGTLVKSDVNGRFIPSPLNNIGALIAGASPTKAEMATIKHEEKQVVGKVVSVSSELKQAGGLEFVQWALEDIEKFDNFNPMLDRHTWRDGEDLNSATPYKARVEGSNLFEQTMSENNLQMVLGNNNYNRRMEERFRKDYGIPGLTDGKNAVKGSLGADLDATFEGTATDSVNSFVIKESTILTGYEAKQNNYFMRTNDTDVQKLAISFMGTHETVPDAIDITGFSVGDKFGAGTYSDATVADFLEITYIDLKQGIVQLKISSETEFNKVIAKCPGGVKISTLEAHDGMNGVSTFLDFEGVIGSVVVLLTM